MSASNMDNKKVESTSTIETPAPVGLAPATAIDTALFIADRFSVTTQFQYVTQSPLKIDDIKGLRKYHASAVVESITVTVILPAGLDFFVFGVVPYRTLAPESASKAIKIPGRIFCLQDKTTKREITHTFQKKDFAQCESDLFATGVRNGYPVLYCAHHYSTVDAAAAATLGEVFAEYRVSYGGTGAGVEIAGDGESSI